MQVLLHYVHETLVIAHRSCKCAEDRAARIIISMHINDTMSQKLLRLSPSVDSYPFMKYGTEQLTVRYEAAVL